MNEAINCAMRSIKEVQTYMKDGVIDNWDLFERVLDYIANARGMWAQIRKVSPCSYAYTKLVLVVLFCPEMNYFAPF